VEARSTYVPALSFHWLTRFYDPILRLTMREDVFKRRLVDELHLAPGHDVLDLGCGTATLTLMVKAACPAARVTGLDGDPEILAIARDKAAAASVALELRAGMAHELPFETASFDRVVSSLVFHHLTTDDKARAFAEVARVLRPGGECHVADWGKPDNVVMGAVSWTIALFDGVERTRANLEGRLPDLMRDAGLVDAVETERWNTLFGTLSLYRATRP
jgi:ubiquinone/menaquinone biosynthesis C-methylase UbiE